METTVLGKSLGNQRGHAYRQPRPHRCVGFGLVARLGKHSSALPIPPSHLPTPARCSAVAALLATTGNYGLLWELILQSTKSSPGVAVYRLLLGPGLQRGKGIMYDDGVACACGHSKRRPSRKQKTCRGRCGRTKYSCCVLGVAEWASGSREVNGSWGSPMRSTRPFISGVRHSPQKGRSAGNKIAGRRATNTVSL